MISQEALQKMLGIVETVSLTPLEMAKKLNITFFPYKPEDNSIACNTFLQNLKKVFEELQINVVPYEQSIITIPLRKTIKRFIKILFNNLWFEILELTGTDHQYHFIHFSALKNLLKRKRIKKGISVIACGKFETWKLPIDYTSSFTENSVITIIDKPSRITKDTSFQEHFDLAMSLFSYHMTQIVIMVNDTEWTLYNFNASHPTYDLKHQFKERILDSLVPKLVAPIRPYKFKDFIVQKEQFDSTDPLYKSLIQDFIDGGSVFNSTGLYPAGKKIDDLPFRNNFYRWIGKIHLDHRNGMSYGFLAKQMPLSVRPLIPFDQLLKKYGPYIRDDRDYFLFEGKIFLILNIGQTKYGLKVPDVWVLTQRSGADKTHIVPEKDILKLGLVDGVMYLHTPIGLTLTKHYRPSFDTKVILAHALGNALIASILKQLDPQAPFLKTMETSGMAIAHWHGYIHPSYIPEGWYVHGQKNPHVACSTPQSAIFAFQGKMNMFEETILRHGQYRGDVHIEPHHGTNINYSSINELATLFTKNPEATVLGNKYLSLYQ